MDQAERERLRGLGIREETINYWAGTTSGARMSHPIGMPLAMPAVRRAAPRPRNVAEAEAHIAAHQTQTDEQPATATSREIYARRQQAVAAAAGHATVGSESSTPPVDVLDDAETVYGRRNSQADAMRRGGVR